MFLLKHKDGFGVGSCAKRSAKSLNNLRTGGVDYMSFIKSFVSKLIKRRKVRAIWEDMLVANLAWLASKKRFLRSLMI